MAMVVTEPCVGCVHADCMKVCPIDTFHLGPDRMVIDPEECIDCEACIAECPEEAIFYEDDVPQQWKQYVELNREYAKQWPLAVDVV